MGLADTLVQDQLAADAASSTITMPTQEIGAPTITMPTQEIGAPGGLTMPTQEISAPGGLSSALSPPVDSSGVPVPSNPLATAANMAQGAWNLYGPNAFGNPSTVPPSSVSNFPQGVKALYAPPPARDITSFQSNAPGGPAPGLATDNPYNSGARTPMVANTMAGGASGDVRTVNIPAMTLPTADPAQRKVLAEANQEKLDAGLSMRAANQASTDAQVAGNEAGAKGLEEQADLKQKAADDAKARAELDKADETAHLQKINEENQKLAAERIDPDRLWNKKSTWGKVVSKLGLAFGAAGAALGHTSNFAMEKLNDEIARDVDAQKADHENRRLSMASNESAYARFRNQGYTIKESTELAQGLMLSKVKDFNDSIIARTQSPGLRAQGLERDAKIKEAMANTRTEGAKEQIATSRYLPASSVQVANGVVQSPAVRAADAAWQAKNVAELQPHSRLTNAIARLKPGENLPGVGIVDRNSPEFLKDAEAQANYQDLKDVVAGDMAAHKRPLRGDALDQELKSYTDSSKVGYLLNSTAQRLKADRLANMIHAANGGKGNPAPTVVVPQAEGD